MRSARHAARIVAALLLAASVAGCGDQEPVASGLAWEGKPLLTRPVGLPADRILTGSLVNRSGRPIELRADAMRLEDRRGRAVPSSVAFLAGYVQGLNPPDRDAPSDLPAPERRRLGLVTTLQPGATAPILVAWRPSANRGAADRLSWPGGSLRLPGAKR